MAASGDLEVQERASILLGFIKYVLKHLEKGEPLLGDLTTFFVGELNPVASKAQKKVPVPEGLDLDAWINDPPSESEDDEESSDEDDPYQTGGGVKKNDFK